MKSKRAVLAILALALVAGAGSAFLLTTLFGSTDNGLRCARLPDKAECEVRQTRFFGLFENSAFVIPESTIRGAKSVCAGTRVGGRSSPGCNVYLTLDSGQDYLVAGYVFAGQAAEAAKRLNRYLTDRSARSIEVKRDLLTPVLVSGVAPILIVTLLLGLRWWRFQRRAPSP